MGGGIIRQLQNNNFVFSKPNLKDYKFFCFDGEVKVLFIASDRNKGELAMRSDFFDENFNRLSLTNGHPNADNLSEKPKMLKR